MRKHRHLKTLISRVFFVLSTCTFLCACKEFNSKDFVGKYQLDHPVLRTKLNYNIEPVLVIKDDNTFELKKDEFIKGKWKFIGFEDGKAKLQFIFLNKSIFAHFSGTIIYFIFPNDFDNGAFESMLYVRLQ